ncbi:MAG: hypothetical protein N4A65_01325 [Cohaesibacter sp.]|nr:hypothetical protein [Cohaesibacter sp.]
MIILALALSGCARNAFVNLENAPVSNGNINSRQVVFGDVLLLNRESGTFNYLGNLIRDQNPQGGDDPLKTRRINKGNYTAYASDDIAVELSGNFKGIEAQAKAQVASSIKFNMEETVQDRFVYPLEVLNAKEVVQFRSSLAPYADDKYRFLFINEAFSGKDIEYSFNGGKQDGASIKLKVAGRGFKAHFKNGSSIKCQGQQSSCIVRSQIWRLVRTSGGATGLKFLLDTDAEANIVFQQGL